MPPANRIHRACSRARPAPPPAIAREAWDGFRSCRGSLAASLANPRAVLVAFGLAAVYKNDLLMNAPSTAAPRQIRTDIRYVVKGERAIFYPAEREKTYWPPEDHVMTLTDMRPLQHQMSVARNGFALVNHVTAMKNFFDPA